jgi:hypothetical protein
MFDINAKIGDLEFSSMSRRLACSANPVNLLFLQLNNLPDTNVLYAALSSSIASRATRTSLS